MHSSPLRQGDPDACDCVDTSNKLCSHIVETFSETSGRTYHTVRIGTLSLIATEQVFTLKEIFHSHSKRYNCLQCMTSSTNKKKPYEKTLVSHQMK